MQTAMMEEPIEITKTSTDGLTTMEIVSETEIPRWFLKQTQVGY